MYSVSKWWKPSHYSKHIFNWSSFQVLFTVFHSSVLILLKKKRKNNVAIQRNIVFCGPALRFVSVFHENGTVSDRYENNSCRVSDRHEVRPLWVRFRPVPCKRMKRNVWRAIRTHTGPSLPRSHVINPLVVVINSESLGSLTIRIN